MLAATPPQIPPLCKTMQLMSKSHQKLQVKTTLRIPLSEIN